MYPVAEERVGPHGYIHGWIFVGVPTPGAEVSHPHHGRGTVFSHSTDYMSVHFHNGHNKQFRVGRRIDKEHHGWSPGPKETHINIEAAGTGGTSMGAFRRTKPAAHLDREGDTWIIRSATGGDVHGQIRPGDRPGQWVADTEDPITGALKSAYHGGDFMAAVTAVLGTPPYGHSWYRVARPPGEVVKSRPRRRAYDSLADYRTAETPVASTVHKPFGSPSGPGLFHVKGLQLPAYVQHVAHHLVAMGHPESQAIEMAVGIIRDWAAGRTPGGKGHVHPDVQAAASKALAEWEAAKAAAHGKGRDFAAPAERRAAPVRERGWVPPPSPRILGEGAPGDGADDDLVDQRPRRFGFRLRRAWRVQGLVREDRPAVAAALPHP